MVIGRKQTLSNFNVKLANTLMQFLVEIYYKIIHTHTAGTMQ